MESGNIGFNSLSWEAILDKFNRNEDYIILHGIDKDYIQCIRDENDNMILENRVYYQDSFKHFVIGKTKGLSAMKINWVVITTKSGLITVQHHEIFNRKEIISIFKDYHSSNSLPNTLNKRNITKLLA